MLKRKLLRSVLPMLLSISMVFGSVPETVSAAEYESHTIEQETLLEEEETVDKRTEALENIPESTGGGVFWGGRAHNAGNGLCQHRYHSCNR